MQEEIKGSNLLVHYASIEVEGYLQRNVFHHKDGSDVDDDDCTNNNADNMVLAEKKTMVMMKTLWQKESIKSSVCSKV
jgi:hypothetical protein